MAGLWNTSWVEECGRRRGLEKLVCTQLYRPLLGCKRGLFPPCPLLTKLVFGGVWAWYHWVLAEVVTNVFIILLLSLKDTIPFPVKVDRATIVTVALLSSTMDRVPNRTRKMPNLVPELESASHHDTTYLLVIHVGEIRWPLWASFFS